MVFGKKTLAGLFSSALLVTSSWAVPTPESPIEKRSHTPFPITGVTGQGIQPRYEIRTLQSKYPDMFNIYILALQKFQGLQESNTKSYYAISAIHGLPMQDWNGVAGNPATNPPVGYCTHISSMFLSWHRPYLALYEQLLQKCAVDAANEFTGSNKSKYLAAANTLRIPYWDWAMTPSSGNAIPQVMTEPTITVTTSTGQQTINNPLYSYKFQGSTTNMDYSPFTKWTQTYRYPKSQSATTSNNDAQLISALNGQQPNLQSRLYNLFTSYPNYMNVSNEMWYDGNTDGGKYDSIESIHDTIHGLVGGSNNGDMGIIDVAAYDPAFWLHHTMIDRFFALWQTIYPNSYVEAAKQVYGTYWYTAGTTLDATTPLYPFHKDTQGNFHTSNSVRNYKTFSYTYPELQSGSVADVKSAINSLYGVQKQSSSKRKRSTTAKSRDDDSASSSGYWDDIENGLESIGDSINQAVGSAVGAVNTLVGDIGSYLGISSEIEYIVNIRCDKSAINGSYFIYVFLGDVDDNVDDWITSSSLVGVQGVSAMMAATQMNSALISGTIPLTRFLEENVALKLLSGLTEDIVIPYLEQNLSWKVLSSCGELISPDAMPSLKVGVVGTPIQKTNSITEFPKWGGFTRYTTATNGKPGGFTHHDDF